jgi:hypothetical protein
MSHAVQPYSHVAILEKPANHPEVQSRIENRN